MDIYAHNQRRRTIRKFLQKPIDDRILLKLLDAARLCPSAGNFQPLRYRIITGHDACEELFSHLKWAAYLPDGAPKDGQKPVAYIIIAQDLSVRSADASLDAGAAAMAMTLCAQEQGISSCWIGSIDRSAVKEQYQLGDTLKILLVLALGYPAQTSTVVPVINENIRYTEDDSGNITVPKRSLEDIQF